MTIQERLRALLGYMDRGDYLVSQEDLAAVREAAAEIDRLQAALKASDGALRRYRYAVAFAAADAWDGGSDIRERFSWAREVDPGAHLSDNEVAEVGKDFHAARSRAAEKEQKG